MNFLSSLPALMVYSFLYFGLTSCKPLEPISEEKFNQGLLNVSAKIYEGLLLFSIAAASSGKNFFKTPQGISEDCIRTARVIAQSFEKPSTMNRNAIIMAQGVIEVSKYKTNNTFSGEVNLLCKNLNEQAKKWPLTFPNFEELKKAVDVPKPAKNYILDVPTSDQNVKEWINSTPMPFDEPEFVKFKIMIQLRTIKNMVSGDENERELIGTAKAIDQLAGKSSYTSTVDTVFGNIFNDFIRNLYAQGAETVNEKNIKLYGSAFVKKLDQDFLNNELLKKEYSKMKKEAMNKLMPKS